MHDTYSPPLWAVVGCLANILVSVAMIWYLILFLSSCDYMRSTTVRLCFFCRVPDDPPAHRFRTVQTVISRQEEIPQGGLHGGQNYRDRW